MDSVLRRMDTSTIVAMAGSAFGVVASIIAGFFAWRSKKDELLFKERQDRISIQASQAKEQSAAAVASADTGFKAMNATLAVMQMQVQDANNRAMAADTKATAAVAHAHECDKTLAYLQAVAKLKGWPEYDTPITPPDVEV